MAEFGFEIAPNFVSILWISQLCPNHVYSQLITRLKFLDNAWCPIIFEPKHCADLKLDLALIIGSH